ncbi:MAG: DNA topoisomerase III [Defluviitaleaceae bacterium]|nr:DNA topoisomerase III [Defluviitaleaceae bacterium]
MSKTLIIAEKPSVGRDIGRVLKATSKGDGFIFGQNYIISWAIGHLVTLCEPEDYDPALKRWTAASLPILPAQIRTKPIKKTASQLRVLTRLMKDKDVSSIICATDSGREGELIFRYIYNHAGCGKPVMRLWISSMTDEAIREGFANLRPLADFDNLYQSALCRSHSDWLVGINASRAYSIANNSNLSIGRVQTPTLAMIVSRQAEIDGFVPKDYWEIYADFTVADGQYLGKWFSEANKEGRLDTKDKASEIAAKVKGQKGRVQSVTANTVRTPPPLLHDLGDLQQEANRRFGFSASKTLSVAQDLYEKRKLITYPRTDSRHLSPDIKLPPVIAMLANSAEYGEYGKYIQSLPKLPITKRIVDASKVTDHHAIIPTGKGAGALTTDEAKIYDLIARRFLAVFHPAHLQNVTEVVTEATFETFYSKGAVVVDLGWKCLYGNEKPDKADLLPTIAEGEDAQVDKTTVKAKKTQPPKPYTEATLLSAMENAGRLVEDDEIAQAMKGSGLGTAATRAATIERLITVGYIVRKGKALAPTDKAKLLIQILPTEITSAETTGRWEKGLNSINQGNMQPNRFMGSIEKFVRYLVEDARNARNSVAFPAEERGGKKSAKKTGALGKCLKCGGDVLENSKSFYCAKWREGCKFTIWKNETARYEYVLKPADVASLLRGEVVPAKIVMPDTRERADAQMTIDVTSPSILRFINVNVRTSGQ